MYAPVLIMRWYEVQLLQLQDQLWAEQPSLQGQTTRFLTG